MKTCSKCKKGKDTSEFYKHKSSPDGFRNECKECTCGINSRWRMKNLNAVAILARAYYHRNKEQCLSRHRVWVENNPEKARSADKSWVARNRQKKNNLIKQSFQRNREKRMETLRKWQRDNPEKIRQYNRKTYRTHVQYYAEYQRSYRKAHPEIAILQVRNRRARLAGSKGKTTPSEWSEIKKRYGSQCLCCGRVEPIIKLTIDHVIPVVMGGSNWPSNIQPLCKQCNSSKGTSYIEYRPERLLSQRCA